MNKYINLLLTIFITVFSISGLCDTKNWEILLPKSKITFKATQNNSPLQGEFSKFSGNIVFDKANLENSNVLITIDMGSVTTSYADIANTLKSKDWFDTSAFPKAVFKAEKFSKLDGDKYQATGTLTIRNKTQPVILNFKFNDYSDENATAEGSTQLKRTALKVGQGEWSDTSAVKDAVEVKFSITAQKKK